MLFINCDYEGWVEAFTSFSFSSGKRYRIPKCRLSHCKYSHSTLNQRIKPTHVESVFYPSSTVRLTACCRSFMLCQTVYIHVRSCSWGWEYVTVVRVCQVAEKVPTAQLCLCVYMYTYITCIRACVGVYQTPSTGWRHPSFNHCRI